MKNKLFALSFVIGCIVSIAAVLPSPWNGKLEITGDGKFKFQKAVLPLQAGKSYQFDFQIVKVPPLSEKQIEHRLVLYAVSGDKHTEIANFGTEVPVDGQVHHVRSAFTVPENLTGEYQLFAYNCNATGTMKLYDFTISVLSNIPDIKIGAVANMPSQATGVPQQDFSAVKTRFGNAERGLLEGNNRFLYKGETVPLKRGAVYEVTFEMCKTKPLSHNPIEHRLVVALKGKTGQISELMYAGENVPVDGQWHAVKESCTLPDAPGDFMVFIYNCNAEGNLEIRNLTFTMLGNAMPWGADKTLIVAGNGKFLGKHYTINAKAGGKYTIQFKMRKTPTLSTNPIEHRVVLSCNKADGNAYEFCYLGETIPVDWYWHEIKTEVTIPADCIGTIKFSVYNCNANGNVELTDFSMAEL